MIKLSPTEEPPEFGLGYRTRDGRPLGEVIAELGAQPTPPREIIREVVREVEHTVYVQVEPLLTWTYWWSYTKRLLTQTWRNLWS